tara:strand:- start:113 stop:802 length:690 start_codon:yes stop_codon:yes gene_type:complete
MAKFNWAYITPDDIGSGFGPTGSVQFMSGNGDTTGSYKFFYHSGATGDLAASTLVLTGTLIVTGTISASHFHIEDVTKIDSTGSTTFGNTNDDKHIRTGSMYVGRQAPSTKNPLFEVNVGTRQIVFSGSGHRANYDKVSAASYTTTATSHILGVSKTGNVVISLHSGSAGGVGQVLVIKDELSSRSGVITISASVPAGNFSIESNGYYELSGTMPAVNLYTDGTNWFVY